MTYTAVRNLGSEWTDEEIARAQQAYFENKTQRTVQMHELRQLYRDEVNTFQSTFVQYARLTPWTRDLEAIIN